MDSAIILGRARTSKVNKMPVIKNTQNMLKNASGILKQVGHALTLRLLISSDNNLSQYYITHSV